MIRRAEMMAGGMRKVDHDYLAPDWPIVVLRKQPQPEGSFGSLRAKGTPFYTKRGYYLATVRPAERIKRCGKLRPVPRATVGMGCQ